jgi:Asp/Glu/hydantoin racemase
MGTRLLIQRVTAGDPSSPHSQAYLSLLKKVIERVKDKDTEVRIRLLKKGMTDPNAFPYSFLHFINDREVLEAILEAEKDGFDSVLVYCFSDPAITEARQAMNIPVFGLAQPAMLTAQMMGGRFGVVAMSSESARRNEELMVKYGLREKVILPIRRMPIPPSEQAEMIEDAHDGIEVFKEVAKAYIKDGAEVIIPACGTLALALRIAPGCAELPNGLTEVDGVPILDVVGCAIKWTEMVVGLKRAGSPWISRAGLYTRPPVELVEASRGKIPYRGSGFIDV